MMEDAKEMAFDVQLTEDEVDRCTHAINELCQGFINDGHSIADQEVQSYLNLAKKLDNLFLKT